MLYSVRLLVSSLFMKKVLFGLMLVAAVFASGGCAFMSDEDRDFYGKGWVRPSDLDKPMPHHSVADPSHPEQAQQVDAPARTASSAPEPQWLIPEQAPQ